MSSFTVSEKSNALIKEKLQKCLFWIQKIPIYPILDFRIFHENQKQWRLPINVCHQAQLKKKQWKDLGKSSEMSTLGVKIFHLPYFRHIGWLALFIKKNSFCQFYRLYWTLASCKKSEKNNEPILRKQCFRGKDGQMNRAEFIRPSSRARGPKKIHK